MLIDKDDYKLIEDKIVSSSTNPNKPLKRYPSIYIDGTVIKLHNLIMKFVHS